MRRPNETISYNRKVEHFMTQGNVPVLNDCTSPSGCHSQTLLLFFFFGCCFFFVLFFFYYKKKHSEWKGAVLDCRFCENSDVICCHKEKSFIPNKPEFRLLLKPADGQERKICPRIGVSLGLDGKFEGYLHPS